MPQDKPCNILYIIDFWASPGGTERHLSYLVNTLDPKKFKCHVVIFNYAPNALVEGARAHGIEIVHIPVARYYTLNALLRAFELARFIRARNIDMVQTFHYKADIYGAVVARLAGVRHIISSKRDAADYKGPFRFFMHKLVRPITNKYIAVSDVVADVIRTKEAVPAKKITTIYNGVDLSKYTVPDETAKMMAKKRVGLDTNDFVIGMSAWFRPEKDHALLFDTYLQLRMQAPNAKLVLVGGGQLLEQYRQWVAERGLQDSIKLIGPVDDVRPYLQAFDVACLVPRINEGFSNSILEKMATGIPVVVTDVGGNKEAVDEGANGFVIEPGSQPQLLQRLLALYQDPARRSRMALASRERAEKLFSLQEMLNRHQALYMSMLPMAMR